MVTIIRIGTFGLVVEYVLANVAIRTRPGFDSRKAHSDCFYFSLLLPFLFSSCCACRSRTDLKWGHPLPAQNAAVVYFVNRGAPRWLLLAAVCI